MGFSLQQFFEQLDAIINDMELDEIDRLADLESYIEEARKYAIECGHISS